MRFRWRILQEGQIPLKPRLAESVACEHRCTAVLLWPETEPPSRLNTVVTDPCFTRRGSEEAAQVLASLGLSFGDLGQFFLTHVHNDHLPCIPGSPGRPAIQPLRVETMAPGMALVPCPGHDPDLRALAFRSADDEEVWIVGDAILDEDWLRAWRYYWPNGYAPDEVRQTWRTVADILSRADLVIPGHGAPIRVTARLVRDLVEGFPHAECSGECPDVPQVLSERLRRLLRPPENAPQ